LQLNRLSNIISVNIHMDCEEKDTEAIFSAQYQVVFKVTSKGA